MTADWYYAKNKQRVGPVTEAQLKELVRSGELCLTDMVWKQGMAKWMEAGQVERLFETISTDMREPPPFPSVPPPHSPGERIAGTEPKHPLLHLWEHNFGTIVAVLGVAFFLSLCGGCVVPGLFGTTTEEHFGMKIETPTTLNKITQAFFVLTDLVLFSTLAAIGIISFVRFVKRDNLYGRWNPLEGNHPWIEFVRGGALTRSDGYAASFRFNKNNTIDVWQEGQAGKTWKVISLGTHELVFQDHHGKLRRYKKGKTLEEKQANPFHRLFHTERADDLPGSWMPIDGSGEWVQFTKDGAIVFSDGGAGKYTVTGEEPNEIIRVTMADGSAREYRVMSLSKAQLVIVEGTEARTYSRHGSKTTAASSSSSEESAVAAAEPPAEQEMSSGVGGVLSGVWNWLRYWNCPKCGKRAAKKTDTSYFEEGQRVQTGWDHETKTSRQMVYSYGIRAETYSCKACGHTWVERSRYSGPA